uniref:Hexosyltransferase n=1 Tax=Petromyzon marinus TaxID=7757 RepID=A0AAJ7SQR9_PETMA|nr:beta-1,3-galactosyltransferase 2-like [Petromyzon marinus]
MGLRSTLIRRCQLLLVLLALSLLLTAIPHPIFASLNELLWKHAGPLLQPNVNAVEGEGGGRGDVGARGGGVAAADDDADDRRGFDVGQMRAVRGREPSTNVPEFRYLLNEPDTCRPRAPFLVVLVASESTEFEAREAIRETWASESVALRGVSFRRLFLLGTASPASDAQRRIEEESRRHGDLIQQNFTDAYDNLTLKTMMGLHWVSVHCPHASYVMKTDSDMFVNLEVLVKAVLEQQVNEGQQQQEEDGSEITQRRRVPPRDYFTGYVMRGFLPNRNPASKWYMPEDMYPGATYPTFCSGTGYVMSATLASRLYRASLAIRRLRLEDVYVGVCLESLGVEPVFPPYEFHFNHWRVSYSPCQYSRIVTSHAFSPSELRHYWGDLQLHRDKPCG